MIGHIKAAALIAAVFLTVQGCDSPDAKEEILGTRHWGRGETPQAACAIANAKAKERAKRIKTCVSTKCIPGTHTCQVGGEGYNFSCYADSANHRGSC